MMTLGAALRKSSCKREWEAKSPLSVMMVQSPLVIECLSGLWRFTELLKLFEVLCLLEIRWSWHVKWGWGDG